MLRGLGGIVGGGGEIGSGFFGLVLHLVEVLLDGGGGAADFGGDGGVVDFDVLLREDLEEEELFFVAWGVFVSLGGEGGFWLRGKWDGDGEMAWRVEGDTLFGNQ